MTVHGSITSINVSTYFQGSVQQLFVADQSARSIKSQVCDVVQTIVTTVHQIYSVFYNDGNKKVPDNKDKGTAVCISVRAHSH